MIDVDDKSEPGAWEREFKAAPWLLRWMTRGVTDLGCRWRVRQTTETVEHVELEAEGEQ